MGWDNPPVPWREFERRLSWGKGAGQPAEGRDARSDEGHGDGGAEGAPRPVVRLPVESASPAWAELHCHSSYSFLDGASSPSDLVLEAAVRGLSVLAITDHDGMYGVPQFAQAAARLRASGVHGPAGRTRTTWFSGQPGRRGQASPIRPAGTCSSSPAIRKGTGGSAGSSAQRS
jgi:error-prone DNA polymerase